MATLVVGDQRYEFDPIRVTNLEAIQLHKATGLRLHEWTAALKDDDLIAWTAAVWLARRRTEQDLRFDSVEFVWADLSWWRDKPPAHGETPEPDGTERAGDGQRDGQGNDRPDGSAAPEPEPPTVTDPTPT